MKTAEKTEKESEEMISRFWECFNAIKATGGIDGKLAYAEAKRQLGYAPPPSFKKKPHS